MTEKKLLLSVFFLASIFALLAALSGTMDPAKIPGGLACKFESESFNNGPISTEGYLRIVDVDSIDNHAFIKFTSYDLDEILEDLALKRFRFIEVIHGKELPLLRYYVAESGSPACKKYYQRIADFPAFRRRARELGLSNLCIAVEETETSLSSHEIQYDLASSRFLGTDTKWNQFTVRDVKSNTPIAKYRYFSYGAGTVHNISPTYSCTNEAEFSRLLTTTITPSQGTAFFDWMRIPSDSTVRSFYAKENNGPILKLAQPVPPPTFVSAQVINEKIPDLVGAVHNFNDSSDADADGRAYAVESSECPDKRCFVINNDMTSIRTAFPVVMDDGQTASLDVEAVYFSGKTITAFTGLTVYNSNQKDARHQISFWILKYTTDGEVISRLNVAIPVIDWKGFPRKQIVQVVELGQSYLITVLDRDHDKNGRDYITIAKHVLEIPKSNELKGASQ